MHATTPTARLTAALLAVLAFLVLPGCTSSDAGTTATPGGCLGSPVGDVALIASGRQNSPAPRLDGTARTVVAAALDAGHTVTIINLDGRPDLAAKFTATDLPANSSRGEALDVITNQIAAQLGALRADDPEVDVLAGLHLGAEHVRASRGAVLLLDSALSTRPPADFTQPGVLASDSADLPRFLDHTGQGPDLHDVGIGYVNTGVVAEPQQPLPPALVDNLRAIYTQLAADSGARCSEHLTTPAAAAAVDSGQPVSLVPIPPAIPFTAATHGFSAPVVLDAATVHFRPDTAELVSVPATDAVLAPIAAHLSAYPDVRVTITGTCASGSGLGTGPDPITLSKERAAAIADRFIAAGINPERLTIDGVGTDFPQFIPDTDAQGRLLPGPAAQNRTVRLTFG